MASFADLLGGFGDAISVGAGGRPNYQIEQKNRQWQAAMDQFNTDPQGGLSRLMGIDREAAGEFIKNHQINQINRAKADAEVANKTDDFDRRTEEVLAGLARTANAGTYAQIRQQMENYAAARKYKNPLNLPETYGEGFGLDFSNRMLEPKDYSTTTETQRHNRATEKDADDNRVVQANLGQARVMATLSGQQAGNYRTNVRAGTQAQAEKGRNDRAAAAEIGRATRAAQAAKLRIQAQHPGAIVQMNRKTGAIRYSTDGGKTWQ